MYLLDLLADEKLFHGLFTYLMPSRVKSPTHLMTDLGLELAPGV